MKNKDFLNIPLDTIYKNGVEVEFYEKNKKIKGFLYQNKIFYVDQQICKWKIKPKRKIKFKTLKSKILKVIQNG